MIFRESTEEADALSDYLRTGSDRFVSDRRRVTALYLTGTAALGVVSLYQMGLAKHVPEPHLPGPSGKGRGMPQEIGFDETRSLIDRGAQLVEVLPPREFEEEHLPGAINVPLKRLTPDVADRLDRARPVVLYCWDHA